MSIGPDRWFSMSRRELKALLFSAAVLLLALSGVQLMSRITRRDEFEVDGVVETVALPERLNVNTAEAYELQSLPGIGEKTANAIASYREENGYFDSLDDLVKVWGIGRKTVDRLRPHLMCLTPESEPSEKNE